MRPGFFGTGNQIHVFAGNDVFGWWCVCRGDAAARNSRPADGRPRGVRATSGNSPCDCGPSVIERLKGNTLPLVRTKHYRVEKGQPVEIYQSASHIPFDCQRCAADLGTIVDG